MNNIIKKQLVIFKKLLRKNWWARLVLILVIGIYFIVIIYIGNIAIKQNDITLTQEKVYRTDPRFDNLAGDIYYQKKANVPSLSSQERESLGEYGFTSDKDYKSYRYKDWDKLFYGLLSISLTLIVSSAIYWLGLFFITSILYGIVIYIIRGRN